MIEIELIGDYWRALRHGGDMLQDERAGGEATTEALAPPGPDLQADHNRKADGALPEGFTRVHREGNKLPRSLQ